MRFAHTIAAQDRLEVAYHAASGLSTAPTHTPPGAGVHGGLWLLHHGHPVVAEVVVVVVVLVHGGAHAAVGHTPRHPVGGAIGRPHVTPHAVHGAAVLAGVVAHGAIHVCLRACICAQQTG